MKYLYTAIIVVSLILLPAFSQAADHSASKMVPIEKYLEKQIDNFSSYVQEPGRTNEELSEALSDFATVLLVYMRSLE